MSDNDVTNAVNNLEQAAIGAGTVALEAGAAKVLGPAGPALVDALGPQVLATLINSLHGLFAHIGAAAPDDLKSAKATVDKWTGGLL